VTKVVQMARIEMGAIKVNRDWVALSEIVASALARLQNRLAAHRVIVALPEDLPLVRVDATLIEQALGNLLENCAKHTPRETVVRVRAQHRRGEILVTVEDYGGGISDRDVEGVFAKFHRGSVEALGTSMGLGLAICRGIVRLHEGQTWAQRVPAGGTAFHLTLPLEEVPPVPLETAAD